MLPKRNYYLTKLTKYVEFVYMRTAVVIPDYIIIPSLQSTNNIQSPISFYESPALYALYNSSVLYRPKRTPNLKTIVLPTYGETKKTE